jgi:hypothetical protein
VVVVALVACDGCRQTLGIDDPELVELGAICTGPTGGNAEQCTANAASCISLTGAAYWCTTSCGTGPAGSGSDAPAPPANGDALCRVPVSSGTPVCGLYGTAQNGVVPWFCALLCGVSGTTDLGNCPPGLACVSNTCQ